MARKKSIFLFWLKILFIRLIKWIFMTGGETYWLRNLPFTGRELKNKNKKKFWKKSLFFKTFGKISTPEISRGAEISGNATKTKSDNDENVFEQTSKSKSSLEKCLYFFFDTGPNLGPAGPMGPRFRNRRAQDLLLWAQVGPRAGPRFSNSGPRFADSEPRLT